MQQTVGPILAISRFCTKLFSFDGRSSRSEFWWIAVIWAVTVSLVGEVQLVALSIASLLMLSLCVRRLHDTGRSGWWILLSFIPIVGAIVLFVIYLFPSVEDEKYGPIPNLK